MLGIQIEAVHGMADIPHTCAAAEDTTCLLTSMLHTLYGRCGCSIDLHSTSGIVCTLTKANKHSQEWAIRPFVHKDTEGSDGQQELCRGCCWSSQQLTLGWGQHCHPSSSPCWTGYRRPVSVTIDTTSRLMPARCVLTQKGLGAPGLSCA